MDTTTDYLPIFIKSLGRFAFYKTQQEGKPMLVCLDELNQPLLWKLDSEKLFNHLRNREGWEHGAWVTEAMRLHRTLHLSWGWLTQEESKFVYDIIQECMR